MEVHVQPRQPRNSENNPGGNRREKEEAHQTHPNRSSPVKRAQSGICIAKGEQRSGDKARRQKPEDQFDPERAGGFAPCGRKGPRLIEQIMGQKKNGLNNCDETDYLSAYTHGALDSATHDSDCCHNLSEIADLSAQMQFTLNRLVPFCRSL